MLNSQCLYSLILLLLNCVHWVQGIGRKELRLYGLFWAGGWRLLECAWGRVIMWPLGTPHPQQKTGTPLSVCSSRGLCLGRVIHRRYQPLISALLHNNNCQRWSPNDCVLVGESAQGHCPHKEKLGASVKDDGKVLDKCNSLQTWSQMSLYVPALSSMVHASEETCTLTLL